MTRCLKRFPHDLLKVGLASSDSRKTCSKIFQKLGETCHHRNAAVAERVTGVVSVMRLELDVK